MSGAEVFAVLGGVASIVSALQAGKQIISSIRKRITKRPTKSKTQAARLQTSLTQGSKNIQREYDQDFAILGEPFGRGDGGTFQSNLEEFRRTDAALLEVSKDALKTIVIRLQQELIGVLQIVALGSNAPLDFPGLVITSDLSQTQTVNTLQDLCQRLRVEAPVQSPPILPTYWMRKNRYSVRPTDHDLSCPRTTSGSTIRTYHITGDSVKLYACRRTFRIQNFEALQNYDGLGLGAHSISSSAAASVARCRLW